MIAWLLALTLAGASPAAPQAQTARSRQAAEAKGVVRGRVFRPDGKPMPRARVVLRPTPGPQRVAETDLDGRYEFTEVRAARYTVGASKGGYLSMEYGATRPNVRG